LEAGHINTFCAYVFRAYSYNLACDIHLYTSTRSANIAGVLAQRFFSATCQLGAYCSSSALCTVNLVQLVCCRGNEESTPSVPEDLLFFADGGRTPRLTILPTIHASLRLGMNFPLAPSLDHPSPTRAFPLPSTNLRHPRPAIQVPDTTRIPKLTQDRYTREELVSIIDDRGVDYLHLMLNRAHVDALWRLVADVKTELVDVEDTRRFQRGTLAEVVMRRKSRLPGKGQVLPFSRGGRVGVAAHSWAVGWLFGVEVYQAK